MSIEFKKGDKVKIVLIGEVDDEYCEGNEVIVKYGKGSRCKFAFFDSSHIREVIDSTKKIDMENHPVLREIPECFINDEDNG